MKTLNVKIGHEISRKDAEGKSFVLSVGCCPGENVEIERIDYGVLLHCHGCNTAYIIPVCDCCDMVIKAPAGDSEEDTGQPAPFSHN